ncbi:MAG: alpha/beta fold hydrolase [Hyphomicrobium sp.]|nr:alpha/beta fold hydrolase [Hyphomicrobium sp.]
MTCDASFKIKGGKTGILLLHRLCGTPVEMRFVANGLAKLGYTVHCPQLAGHCGTPADISKSTWFDWYRSAEDALIELRKECDYVIAGGLSTGAVLALMLAAKHPTKIDATALMAPTLWLNGWMIPWYARLFPLVTHKRLANLFSFPHHNPHGIKDSRIRDFIQRARASRGAAEAGHPVTPGAAVFEHRQLVNAVCKLVPYIRQPSLIVHPLEDDYAALSNATYISRKLQGSVELVVLDDCYHIVTVDRQRHLVVEAIGRFAAALTQTAKPNLVTALPVRASAVA